VISVDGFFLRPRLKGSPSRWPRSVNLEAGWKKTLSATTLANATDLTSISEAA
jgi:hypothetical protein